MAETKPNPLQDFVKICDEVHLYIPSPTECTPSDNAPDMIVICSWTFALVDTNNLLYRPDAWQMRMLFNPAAQVIKSYQDKTSKSPRILVHAYSNGGSHSVVQLAEAYRSLYAADLPISAMILDSAPGVPRWSETVRALQSGIPKTFVVKTLGTVAINGMLLTTCIMHYSGLSELAGSKLYRTLNDPSLGSAFTKATTPRTYILSRVDVMILAEDIESHAETAQSLFAEKGAAAGMVAVEVFVGTAHVNHMPSDPVRYWQIVRDTWDKSLP